MIQVKIILGVDTKSEEEAKRIVGKFISIHNQSGTSIDDIRITCYKECSDE